MSKFGWSLPPGCGKLPGEEPETPDYFACPQCDCQVDISQASHVESGEDWLVYDPEYHNDWGGSKRTNPETGITEILADFWSFSYYDCPNCSLRSREDELIGKFEDEDELDMTEEILVNGDELIPPIDDEYE